MGTTEAGVAEGRGAAAVAEVLPEEAMAEVGVEDAVGSKWELPPAVRMRRW